MKVIRNIVYMRPDMWREVVRIATLSGSDYGEARNGIGAWSDDADVALGPFSQEGIREMQRVVDSLTKAAA